MSGPELQLPSPQGNVARFHGAARIRTSATEGRTRPARMLERQLRARGITDARVLAAMDAVPRELFVPLGQRARAYDDTALRIAAGQTISQPFIVALMLQLARLSAGDRVLEIGAGSGYGAAVMAQLARHVTTIERHRRLVALARANLTRAGSRNVIVVAGDGTRGLPRRAPFDAIVVSAGGPLPTALLQQLAIGGRLVMPRGDSERQTLVRITRRGADDYAEDTFGRVTFVPLVPDAARASPQARRTA